MYVCDDQQHNLCNFYEMSINYVSNKQQPLYDEHQFIIIITNISNIISIIKDSYNINGCCLLIGNVIAC